MNEKDFCKFVDETKGIVLAAVRKYLPARYFHAIDDVVQETYIRAYRALGSAVFADDRAMRNWLYTIAKNESLRMGEKFQREEINARRLQQEVELIGAGRIECDPEDLDTMKKIIKDLPDKYRAVFELLLLGQTEIEISKALKIKKGTVKSRIHRGKNLIIRIASCREGAHE